MSISGALTQLIRWVERLEGQLQRHERLIVNNPLNMGKISRQTIASGSVTVTRPFVGLIPETGTADNLDEILNLSDGKIIVITAADSGDTVTVRDQSVSGTGNIILTNGTTVDLATQEDSIILAYSETVDRWIQLGGGGSGSIATPVAHAPTHQHGGDDEVATDTPGANAIPKAEASGTLATGWYDVGSAIDGSTERVSLSLTDKFGLAVSGVLNWASYQTLRDTIKSYYDSVVATLTNKIIDGLSNTITNIGTSSLTDDAVTNAKLANMAEATVKGRAVGAGTGDPTDLTGTQVRAIAGAVGLTGDESIAGAKTFTGQIVYNPAGTDPFIFRLIGEASEPTIVDLRTYSDLVSYSTIQALSAGGTEASPTTIPASASLLSIIGWGYSSAAADYLPASRILMYVDGTPQSGGDTTDMPGGIRFLTTPEGSATPQSVMDMRQDGRIDIHSILRAMSASGLRLEDDGGNPGVIVNDSGTLTLSTIAANWDAGAFSILASGFQARSGGALNLRSQDGLTRWQLNTDGDLIGYADIGGGSVNDHFYQVIRQPASVTRLQTITIELVSVAAVLVWNTYFDIGLARNGNTAVFGWATGRITWQNQNTAIAANILSYDIASDSSGTTTVTVTAITNGIRIAFGGGDFLNTLDRNSVTVRTLGYDAIRPAVTITIA